MKIEKCPFCGGEAVPTQEDCLGYYNDTWMVFCEVCGLYIGFAKQYTKEQAIAAWNHRAQPESKPLTLDELGQLREARIPVWMGRAKEWIFVASVADAPYAQVWYFNAKGFAQTVLYHHEKFYRSKPKEVEHEAD